MCSKILPHGRFLVFRSIRKMAAGDILNHVQINGIIIRRPIFFIAALIRFCRNYVWVRVIHSPMFSRLPIPFILYIHRSTPEQLCCTRRLNRSRQKKLLFYPAALHHIYVLQSRTLQALPQPTFCFFCQEVDDKSTSDDPTCQQGPHHPVKHGVSPMGYQVGCRPLEELEINASKCNDCHENTDTIYTRMYQNQNMFASCSDFNTGAARGIIITCRVLYTTKQH